MAYIYVYICIHKSQRIGIEDDPVPFKKVLGYFPCYLLNLFIKNNLLETQKVFLRSTLALQFDFFFLFLIPHPVYSGGADESSTKDISLLPLVITAAEQHSACAGGRGE